MKILIVSSYVPYPLTSGGYIRLYNLLKQLSQRHEITLICEKRSKQVLTSDDIKVLEKFCKKVIVIPAKKQWSWQNIAKAGTSSLPFLLTGHTHSAMKQAIIDTLREKRFDVIHVETFYIFQNVPKTYLPIILAEHNIEYLVYERFAKTAPAYMRPILSLDIAKMKYWEKKFWKRATKLVAVSQEDKKYMGREDVVVVPNGVDIKAFPFVKEKERKEKRVLFIGDFKWVQNMNTARWILTEIWPKISEQLPSDFPAKLWIVGKHIPDSLRSLNANGIIFDENAPKETAKIFARADVLLSPITVGGGTSYKILEAMATGCPVVTTQLGVKGLGARHDIHALVGETTSDLAKHVETLLLQKRVAEKIRSNARKLIEEHFTWETIAKTLEGVYRSAL
ncbi:MAG: glycosyltransferase family 4 protein [Candidatus Levyibacteriota bacterium]